MGRSFTHLEKGHAEPRRSQELPPDPRLLMLRYSAGNAALARWLAPARPVLQRRFLDQQDKSGSVRAALAGVQQIDGVVQAVSAYERITNHVAGPLEAALNGIITAAGAAREAIADEQAGRLLSALEAEAQAAHLAVVKADGYAAAAENPEFMANSELIAAARRDVKAMKAQFGNPRSGKSTQQALFALLDEVLGKLGRVETARIQQVGVEGYTYGDPQSGAVDARTKGYLDAFAAVKAFLANKPLVLQHLRPLAAAVDEAPDKLAALKAELRRKEGEAGFGVPKVPLGILPGDVFVGLLRDGTVLDDFGAGLQHGELSHRIQWYAIIGYLEGPGKEVEALKAYTAIDLFKQINEAPFSPDRQGNTMWGSVLDAGTSASAKTYSAPGTLNRDLLEASPGFKATGVGLAERNPGYQAPDTKGLESIGDALIQLRELRMQQAAELGGFDGDKNWKDYGVPPPELAQAIEKSMAQGGGYETAAEGVTDGRAWKVLQEKAEQLVGAV